MRLAEKIFLEICSEGALPNHVAFHESYACASEGETPKGILAANWNNPSRWDEATSKMVDTSNAMERAANVAEKLGFELAWSDEWEECSECLKLVRTNPDCAFWVAKFHRSDEGWIACEACCVKDHTEEVLEDLSGNHRKALTMDLDFGAAGWVAADVPAFKNGLYGGMASSPEKIADVLRADGVEDFVFRITDSTPFETDFDVLVKAEMLERAEISILAGELTGATDGEDPAEAMKRGLKNIPAPSSDGITHSTVGADGSVTTRTLTPEEFIRGDWARETEDN